MFKINTTDLGKEAIVKFFFYILKHLIVKLKDFQVYKKGNEPRDYIIDQMSLANRTLHCFVVGSGS